MTRASKRWLHSHQKIVLKSESVMPALSCRYCGINLYASNARSHSFALSGGSAPVTGFHSTIESPDSVSRVAPPTSTIAAISTATEMSHQRTARCGSFEVEIVVISAKNQGLNQAARPL